jgi:hypothetical protein
MPDKTKSIASRRKPFSRGTRRLSSAMLLFENAVKIPLFSCQRCGECILSHTALICSQRCPKRLRNGPCGGTRPDGHCEVYPERKCIWNWIVRRSRLFHRTGFLLRMEKIHNWDLEKTSAWLNVFTRRIDPPALFRPKRSHDDAEG